MSIWSSWPAPVSDEPGWPSPYEYPVGWSNRYPDETLPREGYVDIAAIPAHVRYWRDNPDATPEGEPTGGWDPNWLRLGVNEGVVILDRSGVELVYRTLGEWLEGRPE